MYARGESALAFQRERTPDTVSVAQDFLSN
jgi:hypothetical protein